MKNLILAALVSIACPSVAMSAASAPRKSEIPVSMRGTWADAPEFCEEELTNGVKIDRNSISYYGGLSELKGVPLIRSMIVGSKPGTDFRATMSHRGEGRRMTVRTRLTQVGDVIYVSSGDTKAHLTSSNRMIRCKSIRRTEPLKADWQ